MELVKKFTLPIAATEIDLGNTKFPLTQISVPTGFTLGAVTVHRYINGEWSPIYVDNEVLSVSIPAAPSVNIISVGTGFNLNGHLKLVFSGGVPQAAAVDVSVMFNRVIS